MKKSVYIGLAVSALFVTQLTLADDVRCDSGDGPSGWRVYVDHTNRFCFQYPPAYKIRHYPTRRDGMILELRGEGGDILIWFDQYPFGEHRFEELSRTGNLPEEKKIGRLTFYYNGPGGGGVDYSDDYLFNLRGRLLHIEFDGPYIHDNHPAPKVRELEPKLLATFRTF